MPLSTALLLLFLINGCTRDFGTGGTGEYTVPRERLRAIDAARMEDLGTATPTSTQPSTRSAATQPAAEARLAIEDCRRMALANNLDLRVELLNPTIARTAISEEEARFESIFTGSATYLRSDQPTGRDFPAGVQSRDLAVDAGLRLPLRTGGIIDLAVPVTRQESLSGLDVDNDDFSDLNPLHTSDFSASLSQPLLRGFGYASNSHAIRVAFYQWQASEARAKLEVIRVLANVDRGYWRLAAARRQLEVRREEYDLAVQQLGRAQRRAAARMEARVEVTRAESGVADTVESIIIAENLVRDRQRELKRILNDPSLPMSGGTVVIPMTPPSEVFYRLNPTHLVRIAHAQRMEMLETELRILQETSSVAFARNQTLPLLSVEYVYNVSGLGASLDDSFRMTGDKDFEDHRVGVSVEVPIGNEAARSRLRRSLASRAQQIATKELRAQTIEQEVLNAVDQLEANWQRILAARQRVALARRVLELEQRQFNNELRTSTEVLEAQTRLTDAESSLTNALAEYQIAQVDLAFATGTVLGAARIVWDPIPAPQR